MTANPLHRPAPAIAAAGGPFQVRPRTPGEGGASREPSKQKPGIFEAPLNGFDPESLGIRAHEYGHLAVSRLRLVPKAAISILVSVCRVNEHWVQGALDVFVNRFMLDRGNLEIGALRPIRDEFTLLMSPRWVRACVFLRSEGLDCEAENRETIRRSEPFTAEEIRLLQDAADYLVLAARHNEPLSLLRLRSHLRKLQQKFGPFPGQDDQWPEAETVSATVPVAPPESAGADSALPPYNEWGSFEVINAPLPVVNPSRSRSRRRTPARVGPLLFPHRGILPSGDGKAFGLRRRDADSSMLIDVSGSMRIDQSTLATLLSRAPAMTIGLYASLPGDLTRGRLIVAASRGRVVADPGSLADQFGIGNVVDGPALGWLAKQAAPRFWISDGVVTGRNDTPASNLCAEAAAIKRSARIQRLAQLEAFLGTRENYTPNRDSP